MFLVDPFIIYLIRHTQKSLLGSLSQEPLLRPQRNYDLEILRFVCYIKLCSSVSLTKSPFNGSVCQAHT